jgi:hypothetical protein
MNHQTFIVIPTAAITEEFLEEFHQDSLATVRKSLDGKLSILAFEGEKPNALVEYEAMKGALRALTHDEALALMATAKWTASNGLTKPTIGYPARWAAIAAVVIGAAALVYFLL